MANPIQGPLEEDVARVRSQERTESQTREVSNGQTQRMNDDGHLEAEETDDSGEEPVEGKQGTASSNKRLAQRSTFSKWYVRHQSFRMLSGLTFLSNLGSQNG